MTTVPESAQTVHFDDTTWATAVRRISELAQAKVAQELHSRIQMRTALVLSGGVWFDEDGQACQVRASDGTWYSTNGHCTCKDYPYAPERLCKHRAARGLYLRAQELLRTGVLEETASEAAPQPKVLAQYIVMIQGKPFVKFAGLLQMAHEKGLVELRADWTFNDAELSLAHAVAIFENGNRFEESGDSAKENVTTKVAPHWRRVALTRAKARALRDALGVDLVLHHSEFDG